MPADRKKFGLALKNIRERKDIPQKELLNRIHHRYTDESSYRRIESGKRTPGRLLIVEILTAGLEVTDSSTINEMLALAGYEGLSESELTQLGVRRFAPGDSNNDAATVPPATENTSEPLTDDHRISSSAAFVYAGTVAGALLCTIVVCLWTAATPVWFVTVTAGLYSALYAVSILLETAYQPRTGEVRRVALLTFCFILLTSVAAFALDSMSSRTQPALGLLLALGVMLFAGAAQWVGARQFLPAVPIVVARFQPHTAQSAHLKNTGYFLLSVVFFWLPPWHCASVLESHVRASQPLTGSRTGAGPILFVTGMPCPNPDWLWGLFVLVVLVSIPMGSRLLDNLKPHPYRNRYQNLFYTRALLYYSLTILCVLWYSLAISRIAQ